MTKKILFVLLLTFLSISAVKDYTVYITPTGSKYHTEYCRTLKKKIIPIKKSEAIEQGYEACKVCDP